MPDGHCGLGKRPWRRAPFPPHLHQHDRSWTKQVTFLHYRPSFCLRGKAAMAARPPSCVIFINHHKCLSGKASMAERPPLAPTYLSLHHLEHLLPFLPPGSARRDDPQVIQIQSDRPVFLVLRRLLPWIDPKWSPYLSCSPTGCCHGKIQSDLPNPSLLKRARAPSGRPPLAFPRSPLDSLLAGFLLLFLILDDFHSSLHPWIFSLSRITGCASTPTPLGAPSLVVWLGLTTSWRRTTERKLRGFWGGCDGTFHMFHQVLGWSSCLRSPTNRHAVVRLGRIVSPDSLCHLWFYYSSIITTSIALSTRTNALSVCGISKPPWQSCNGRVRRH